MYRCQDTGGPFTYHKHGEDGERSSNTTKMGDGQERQQRKFKHTNKVQKAKDSKNI